MGENHFKTGEILAIIGVSLPIGGWLADAYIGRYRVIRCGMWAMWMGAILNGFSLVLSKVVVPYGIHGDRWVTLIAKIIAGAGFGAFQANIVQFGIDQLIDASSTEISSFIMWYTMSLLVCGTTVNFSSYCTPDYVAVLVITLYLTLAIGSNVLFNHFLIKDQVMNKYNSLSLILKVVCFTVKNKKNIGKTYQHCGALSSFNVAKRVYAGPFTNEQVEDVKTFFRVLVVMAVFMITCSGIPTVNSICDMLVQHLRNWPNTTDLRGCYKQLSVWYVNYTFLLVIFLTYETIIHPLFHACIPKMKIITKFFCSVLLFLAGVLSLLGIESTAYVYQLGQNQTTIRCVYQNEHDINLFDVDFYWIIIPNVFNGLSTFLFIFSGIEFICAQAPMNMKGLVLGITYTLYGVGSLIQVAISIPFIDSSIKIWEKAPLTCGVWYFMMQGMIVLVSSVVVAVIIKTYKRRKRMNVYSQSEWQQTSQVDPQ